MATSITITKRQDSIKYSRPLEYVLSVLKDGEYEMSITRKVKRRTISQNNLMWMWFTCISKETGTTIQDVHDTYCARFIQRRALTPQGDVILVTGSTSKLTTDEMQEFMGQVKADAAEMGIMLPLPEDLYYQDFVNEYQRYL